MLYFGAPGKNRTCNSGLEVRSYIHLTTGAFIDFYDNSILLILGK